jgi:tryptophanyl-tRNA synthetase
MSKSSLHLSLRILLTVIETQIKSKIQWTVTDSMQGLTCYPPSFLLTPRTLNPLAIYRRGRDGGGNEVHYQEHWDLKNNVADAVEEMLKVPRGELVKLRDDTVYLESAAKDGVSRAQERSRVTLNMVRKLVGLC